VVIKQAGHLLVTFCNNDNNNNNNINIKIVGRHRGKMVNEHMK
jgi:hypothetical protein